MRRDLDRFEATSFDLLIVGGGIQGAWAAWDATLRGLRTALVEQDDFGSGVTANSLRIVHGGLRSLGDMDVRKCRISAREQAIMLRVVPSLVQPLPCLIPLYRGSRRGPAAFKAAFAAYRALTGDLFRSNRLGLPRARVLSVDETLSCSGALDRAGLVGGALWYDAQVPDIERLVLSLVHAAADQGLCAANHVRARRILVEGGRIRGVEASDELSGRALRIQAKAVLNAAGPWCRELVTEQTRFEGSAQLPQRWCQAVNLVLSRAPLPVAIGVQSRRGPESDPVLGGHRFLFMTGWKDATLAGTSYRLENGAPSVESQARDLLEEWNEACPGLELTTEEVSHHHAGRLPLREGIEQGRPLALLDRPAVVQHGSTGLVSVVPTKFSTARHTAQRATDLVERVLGVAPARCQTTHVVLPATRFPAGGIAAQVRHAIREEMACTLEDLVLRRMGLGLTRCPPVRMCGEVADVAAQELGWSERQTDRQIETLLGRFTTGGVTRAA